MTRDTLETALTILAESDQSGRGAYTVNEMRHAVDAAITLEALARGFKRREEDRCSFPLTDARQAAYDRADTKAAEKARDALAPYGLAASIGGDVRGSQIHILTPLTGRRFRVFRRTWWANKACTVPSAGRKFHVCYAATEAEAREECRSRGLMAYGATMRGPRGAAYEYESA